MALEGISIKVQEYMNIVADTDGIAKVNFDTDLKISELIEELSKKQEGTPPLGKEFLAIYNENNEECSGDSTVSSCLSDAKTLILDYKDHVVLQFTTIGDENLPVFKFKFVAYAEACKDKTKVKKALAGKVEKEDVITAKMEEDLGENASAANFSKHLKFYWKSANLTDRFAANFITKGACMNAVIRVLIDAFEDKHNHFVITMEDNWVAKEFMSVSYNPAYIKAAENSKN